MEEKRNFEQLNKDVSEWAKYQSQRMQRLVGSLTLKDKHAIQKAACLKAKYKNYKPLTPSIGHKVEVDKMDSRVSRINFRFAKHGIYLEHGVGRRRPVRSSAANPKPWLNPILDPAIDVLADLIQKNYADIAAGSLKFFIPGILDRRIKIDNGQP